MLEIRTRLVFLINHFCKWPTNSLPDYHVINKNITKDIRLSTDQKKDDLSRQMFLSLHLLKWPSHPKFISPITSLSVLPVGMQTYISSISSPLMQDGARDTSIQAAAGMQGPYQWCKNAFKPHFAKCLCWP